MNSTLLSKVVSQAYFIRKESSTLGAYFIKLKDTEYKNFRPIVILHRDKLIIQIDTKSLEILFEEVNKVMFDEESKTIMIKLKDELIEFSLVSIDGELNQINNEYTFTFFSILQKQLAGDLNISDLLSTLPNQMSSTFSNQGVLPIIIASIFMITVGFILQPINFVLGWFSFIGGFISGIIGLMLLVIRRN